MEPLWIHAIFSIMIFMMAILGRWRKNLFNIGVAGLIAILLPASVTWTIFSEERSVTTTYKQEILSIESNLSGMGKISLSGASSWGGFLLGSRAQLSGNMTMTPVYLARIKNERGTKFFTMTGDATVVEMNKEEAESTSPRYERHCRVRYHYNTFYESEGGMIEGAICKHYIYVPEGTVVLDFKL